jgi:hypothetical protein
MIVTHFEQVDLSGVEATFTPDGQHRSQLKIPLKRLNGGRTLCIVGQNPSKANASVADKTIRFLEKFVFERMPEFSQILMLNLYSRVDTRKEYTDNLNHHDCELAFQEAVRNNTDFLLVFGKLKNEGAYNFIERANELRLLLRGKNVFKFDIGSTFAPHPGNPKILYQNFNIGVTDYDFADIHRTDA